MKINWGYKIALVYIGFVLFMLALVWRTMQEKVELVTKDYYAQELVYQDKIDRIENTKSLTEQVNWELGNQMVKIIFPTQFVGKSISGNVLFFRPSDSSKDFSINLSPDSNGTMTIKSDKFIFGVYRMQIDWQVGGKNYFSEAVINMK